MRCRQSYSRQFNDVFWSLVLRPDRLIDFSVVGSELAVVLFNRDEVAARISVTWTELGVAAAQKMTVRDVINRKDLRVVVGKLDLEVGRHDVAFVLLKPH